jgi:hypothetical protein
MTAKKLGATGRVTPKVKQHDDPIKDRSIHGTANAGAQGVRTFGRPTARRRDRRIDLLNIVIRQHGVSAVALLLGRLEHDFGDELQVNRRLEALIDADPRVISCAFNAQIVGPRS